MSEPGDRERGRGGSGAGEDSDRDPVAAPSGPQRVSAALRRHGLLRRPPALRHFARARHFRFTDGNRLRLFDSGRAGLEAMLGAIATASRWVHLETYILRSDDTGRSFLAAMGEKARRGVAVRLLYDGFGSFGLDTSALHGLRDTGADIVAFNPLRRTYPRWLPRRRDHRKILVVDGRIAFVGGLNIGDEYYKDAEAGPLAWRDTHVQVEGPAVTELDALFLESWFRADGPDLPWWPLLTASPDAVGDTRCAVVADGPSYRRRVLRDLVVAGLDSARRTVRLTSPYFAPDRKVLGALADASARGVEVALLLAGRSDHPILRRAARSLLPRLLDAGVTVYEYESSMLHAKSSLFDDQWAIVGTSNLDRQSFEHSYEVNLIIDTAAAVQELAAIFARDVTLSRRVDRDVLAARGWLERAGDWLAAQLLRFI